MLPRSGGGAASRSGTRRIAIEVPTSSGRVGAHSRKRCRTAAASSPAKKMPPPNSEGTGTSSNSSAVTTPKLPLPAAERPEELGVGVRGDPAQPPVGGDDLDGGDVIGGEAVRAAERPMPPPSV